MRERRESQRDTEADVAGWFCARRVVDLWIMNGGVELEGGVGAREAGKASVLGGRTVQDCVRRLRRMLEFCTSSIRG